MSLSFSHLISLLNFIVSVPIFFNLLLQNPLLFRHPLTCSLPTVGHLALSYWCTITNQVSSLHCWPSCPVLLVHCHQPSVISLLLAILPCLTSALSPTKCHLFTVGHLALSYWCTVTNQVSSLHCWPSCPVLLVHCHQPSVISLLLAILPCLTGALSPAKCHLFTVGHLALSYWCTITSQVSSLYCWPSCPVLLVHCHQPSVISSLLAILPCLTGALSPTKCHLFTVGHLALSYWCTITSQVSSLYCWPSCPVLLVHYHQPSVISLLLAILPCLTGALSPTKCHLFTVGHLALSYWCTITSQVSSLYWTSCPLVTCTLIAYLLPRIHNLMLSH